LLRTTDSLGDLPAGVTALTQNTSDLRLFEEKLNTQTPRTVLYNAVDAIGRLADPEYDGRRIRYYTSIGPLADLYENSADEGLREEIVGAIGPIGSKFCYDHLVRWLPGASPRIKAAILRELWRCYGSDSFTPIPWHDTLIKLLHKYTTWSDKDCLYLDLEFGENDFRFWVFRCLGVARKRSSKPYILRFLGTKTWPFAVVAEAAAAHWEITRSDKYVGVLRKADRLGVACGASVTLRTYQGISEVNQRQEIEDGWSAINSLTPNGA